MSLPTVETVHIVCSRICCNPLTPFFWYGRQVAELFSALPNGQDRAEEIAQRIIKAALLIAIPVAIGFAIFGTYKAIACGAFAAAALFGATIQQSSQNPRPLMPSPLPSAFKGKDLPSSTTPGETPETISADLSQLASTGLSQLEGHSGIQEDLTALNTELDYLYEHVDELATLDAQLSSHIMSFESKYNGVREQHLGEFIDVDCIKEVLFQLRKYKKDLLSIKDPTAVKGTNLFQTCALALKQIESQMKAKKGRWPKEDVNLNDIKAFRNTVIGWMKQNYLKDVDLRTLIDSALDDYFGSQSFAISTTSFNFEHYLKVISEDPDFSSKAELHAISQMFKTPIRFQRVLNGREVAGLDSTIGAMFPEPHITIKHVGGNTFSS